MAGEGRAEIFEQTAGTWNQTLNAGQPMNDRGNFSMRYIINSTTTRTQGWQADCWNWAKANLPFELYGVESQHLGFCKTVAAACRFNFRSRRFHNEAVATFEPSFCPG